MFRDADFAIAAQILFRKKKIKIYNIFIFLIIIFLLQNSEQNNTNKERNRFCCLVVVGFLVTKFVRFVFIRWEKLQNIELFFLLSTIKIPTQFFRLFSIYFGLQRFFPL